MIETVFISDLHLHPNDAEITSRFNRFIDWAVDNAKRVYILGDLFHAWPGDDAIDEWSQSIAKQLARLASHGVKLYFMAGNRDFLVGQKFAKLACMSLLKEPTVITLGDKQVLLVHGDRYCTEDKGHQWLRRLTRNAIFPSLFLRIPYSIRAQIVNTVRKRSQGNRRKTAMAMDIVTPVMLHHMQQLQVDTLIHGHIHKPGLTSHQHDGADYHQYVLSDWDDNPTIMCYDNSCSLYFMHLAGE